VTSSWSLFIQICTSFIKLKLHYIADSLGLLCGLPDGSGLRHDTLTPGDTAPCIHWAVPWVGPRTGTDNLERTKISSRTEIGPHSVVTLTTELFWVRESLNES